jgi:hypothetical protein
MGKIEYTLLVASTERFMPVLGTTATISLFPTTHFSAGMVLINKEALEVFCIEEKGQPAPDG